VPACILRGGGGRASQVPGEPSCAYAMFSDPGRTNAAGHTLRQHGPRSFNDEGSLREVISGLNSTAWVLAVYASSVALLHHDARLASGCWPSSTRRGSNPQGSNERFPRCFLHQFPLSQASWRSECPAFLPVGKCEIAKQKSMGKLDFRTQVITIKGNKKPDLVEFAKLPWVTHFDPQLPQNQSLKRPWALNVVSTHFAVNVTSLAETVPVHKFSTTCLGPGRPPRPEPNWITLCLLLKLTVTRCSPAGAGFER
jgi:hypothetical protein